MSPAVPDIHDIRGPIVAAAPHAWWPYAVVAATLIAIAIAVRYALRRRRRAVPPDRRALLALEATRPLIERPDPRAFSTGVSEAVRAYVEARFGLHAPRLTTEELLGSLMIEPGPIAAHRQELGTFLEFCDLAKYARFSLSRGDMTGMLDSAEVFVRATSGGVS